MDLAALKAALREAGSVCFRVRVIPRCQQTEWGGTMDDGTLRVRLHAVPEKGKANEALLRFLASEFAVTRAQAEIVAGASSRDKRVSITTRG